PCLPRPLLTADENRGSHVPAPAAAVRPVHAERPPPPRCPRQRALLPAPPAVRRLRQPSRVRHLGAARLGPDRRPLRPGARPAPGPPPAAVRLGDPGASGPG